MTVSRFGSGLGRGIFFSCFFSCFTGTLSSGSSSAASLVAILRDVRGGARRLLGASFPVEVSESSLTAVISVILHKFHTRSSRETQTERSNCLPGFARHLETWVVEICEYDGDYGLWKWVWIGFHWLDLGLTIYLGRPPIWIGPPRNPTLSYAESYRKRRFSIWPGKRVETRLICIHRIVRLFIRYLILMLDYMTLISK